MKTLTESMAMKPGVTPADVYRNIGARTGRQFPLPDITIRLEWLVLEDTATKVMYEACAYYTLNLGQKGVAFGSLLDRDLDSYCGIV